MSASNELHATAADLPPAVAAALADPPQPQEGRIAIDGIEVATLMWRPEDPGLADPPPGTILLIHGITGSSRTWWRIGPALAAAGHRVVAIDSPAHGLTRGWRGTSRFAETAAQVAALAHALDPDPEAPGALAVVGHSWGSLVTAALPTAGLRPDRLVLLDPPFLDDAEVRALFDAAAARAVPVSRAVALAQIADENPGWLPADVEIKAWENEHFDRHHVAAIILENHWDGGLAAIDAAAAAGYPAERYRVIRGIPSEGGMLPDTVVPVLAARIGGEHVVTLAGAPHSPQRTHPEALTLALLHAVR